MAIAAGPAERYRTIVAALERGSASESPVEEYERIEHALGVAFSTCVLAGVLAFLVLIWSGASSI
jgi:hypothetical protein